MAHAVTSEPLFTVIVPTYGRPRYLREALDSVAAQTITDLECLVVDDAGPSRPSLPPDPRFRLIRRGSNGGPAAARNSAIDQARGRYVAFLDDDDVFVPERLELAMEGLSRAPIAICWSRTIGDERSGGRTLEGDVHDRILDATTPHLGTTAVVRDRLERFDERFLATQDVEWWLRMSRTTELQTVPRVGLLYRRHGGARNRNGTRARIDASFRLMELEASYFDAHPRAAAFRWMRIGLMARDLGDPGLSRRAFLRSLRARPSARTVAHLARSTMPIDRRSDPAAVSSEG